MKAQPAKIPPLKISTGWIVVQAVAEPEVIITFKGYSPILRVRVIKTSLEYYMYLSAKSIADGLEPLRVQNNGSFIGLSFQIRKENEDKFAPYIIQIAD